MVPAAAAANCDTCHRGGFTTWATGRLHANVTVAREPGEPERDALARQLSRLFGKRVVPHISTNPAILGGLIVKVGDTVMDGSVRKRLSVLKQRMLTTVSR
jgi:F-type H+-transporting ATPase subunit delta